MKTEAAILPDRARMSELDQEEKFSAAATLDRRGGKQIMSE